MKRIISKTVLALWPGGGLLEDAFFKEVRRTLGQNPAYSQTEESGADKKNVIPTTGFGSRWRENNPGAGIGTGYEGEESPSRGVGSGYNNGERPDVDELGPGFSPKIPEVYPHDNELFIDLEIKNSGDNIANQESIRKNLKKMLHSPGVSFPRRTAVDRD